jgi:hypothetical protein
MLLVQEAATLRQQMRYSNVCECDVCECVYTCRYTASLGLGATIACAKEIQNAGWDVEHARVRRFIEYRDVGA